MGLSRFATFVLDRVNYLLAGDVQALQDTRAIVVQNASGVGKTVSSIAVCEKLSELAPELLYLPLYLGFSSSFRLAVPEEDLILFMKLLWLFFFLLVTCYDMASVYILFDDYIS